MTLAADLSASSSMKRTTDARGCAAGANAAALPRAKATITRCIFAIGLARGAVVRYTRVVVSSRCSMQRLRGQRILEVNENVGA